MCDTLKEETTKSTTTWTTTATKRRRRTTATTRTTLGKAGSRLRNSYFSLYCGYFVVSCFHCTLPFGPFFVCCCCCCCDALSRSLRLTAQQREHRIRERENGRASWCSARDFLVWRVVGFECREFGTKSKWKILYNACVPFKRELELLEIRQAQLNTRKTTIRCVQHWYKTIWYLYTTGFSVLIGI